MRWSWQAGTVLLLALTGFLSVGGGSFAGAHAQTLLAVAIVAGAAGLELGARVRRVPGPHTHTHPPARHASTSSMDLAA